MPKGKATVSLQIRSDYLETKKKRETASKGHQCSVSDLFDSGKCLQCMCLSF